MLEKMAAFFEARLEGYDEHMLTAIESAETFYPFTASLLPKHPDVQILDLGCGTGLELEYYFRLQPSACVTGIDLSAGMLAALKNKFPERSLQLVQGSYFDILFPASAYDAAVSVESLHHFTKQQKLPLYQKTFEALKADGIFVLTDYFADTYEQENFFRSELIRLKAESGINDHDFYHYDTPLTVKHETETLLEAGFTRVSEVGAWGATHTLIAYKV